MAPMIGVSHGEWHTVVPDPPSGDYDAVLLADQKPWRITSVSQSWEEISGLNSNRITSPPGLPAVWYAWRGSGASATVQKTTNNGTSWSDLATLPFTPSAIAAEITAWPDHLIAATDGILLTTKWSSVGNPGSLRLKNIYYSTDDGVSWSQVYGSDLANGNTQSVWNRENLVVNTVYTWYVGTGSDEIRRISHGGGLASETTIALPTDYQNIEMLACDSTLAGTTTYAVARFTGLTARKILKVVGTTVTDVTPPWGLSDADLGNVWLAVAGDTVMALAYGWDGSDDTASIWRSLDAGATWTKVRDWNADLNPLFSTSGYKAVGVSPNRPQTWFVWANNHESIGSKVMRSTDNGITWEFVNLPSADPLGDDDQIYIEVRVLG